ncbi:MAG TPA: heat-inducible transcriptional repressor HrcA [Candidatus Onthovivens sp.]|nr:heat-inducible transcriptional repressor HrcA [Candidatus Onthovivens sp.]
MNLDRKQKLFKLIIEDFIKYAQPVGSHYLLEKYDLPYSSATIRSEMSELEKDGLLEKTHTSSGRIPSTKGYKYYVENLRDRNVDSTSRKKILQLFQNSGSIEEVIKESCEILSSMTNLTSVVLGPRSESEYLANIQVIPLSKNSCTAIFLTNKGYVESKTFVLNNGIEVDDVKKCLEMLDLRLKGTKISELAKKTEYLQPLFKDYVEDYNYLYLTLIKTFSDLNSARNEFFGKENLLSQPEFKDDIERMRMIFDLFNDPSEFEKLFKHSDELLLGLNSSIEYSDDMSIISKELGLEGEEYGRIAVIGPKRMDYANVIAMLEFIGELAMKRFKELHKEERDDSDEEE